MPAIATPEMLFLFEDEVREAGRRLATMRALVDADTDEVAIGEATVTALQACMAALAGAERDEACLLLARKPDLGLALATGTEPAAYDARRAHPGTYTHGASCWPHHQQQPREKERSMGFKFKLGEKVAVAISGEAGEVLGRAEYTTAANNYYVRYRSADGRAVEAWWQEDALVSTE